jgi:hypothetical protein
MKAHNRTRQPTMTQAAGPGRPYLEVYHIHYGPGYRVKAVLRSHKGGYKAVKVHPLPEWLSDHKTAHGALQAIGADPREVLGPGALARAGLAEQE